MNKNFLYKSLLCGFISILSVVVASANNLDQSTFKNAIQKVASDLNKQHYPGITSMIVSVDGILISENYAKGISKTDRHDLRSATKSITAILIGQLISEGRIKSVNSTVSSILPERFADFPANDPKREITLVDLMTMRSGLACDDWVPASLGNEEKMYKTNDWVQFILQQPFAHEIGKHFSYCTGGVVLLGEVIEKITGVTVTKYSENSLFTPLGIKNTAWANTPNGGTDTGGHLQLTALDFHLIGELISNKGVVNKKAIVNKKWLKQMVSFQTKVYERRSNYGYLWWIDKIQHEGETTAFIYAHGNGGNFIFILPEYKLVASFTGINYGNRLQFQPITIFTKIILPSFLESN